MTKKVRRGDLDVDIMGPKCPKCKEELSNGIIEKVWGFKVNVKALNRIRERLQ